MANEYLTTTNNIEVLGASTSNAQTASMTVQVLNSGGVPNIQVSSMTVQVLRSITDQAPDTFLQITGGLAITGGVTFT